jgi:hypothetical protein
MQVSRENSPMHVEVHGHLVVMHAATCKLGWDFPEEERMMQYSRDNYFP